MKKFCLLSVILIIIFAAVPFFYSVNVNTQTATQFIYTYATDSLEVRGVVEPSEYSVISLSYPIYVKECFVSENSLVNKGQLMFTLDIDKMKEALESYGASSGFNKNDISAIQEKVYATQTGTVKELAAYEGALIMAEENLCIIQTSQSPMLKITINQEDYQKISVGDSLEFNTVISPQKTYYGTIIDKTAVIRKEASLSGSKTVIDIYAQINNPDEYITQGVEFTGKIVKENDTLVKTLPYEYINQDENGEYVTTFSSGKVNKIYIETGKEFEETVEILTEFDNNTVFLENNSSLNGSVLLNYE